MTSEAVLELRPGEDAGRLDVFLSERLEGLSRSAAQRLIAAGEVLVNGTQGRASQRLVASDVVTVRHTPEGADVLSAERMPLAVVYEDEDLLVVDKPPGLVVHPAPGHPHRTLANALVALRPGIGSVGGPGRAGIVHRLDKDTSGLLMVAKNEGAHRYLSGLLKRRQVRKAYLALVAGDPSADQAVVEAPVARDPRHPQRMAVSTRGREAKTAYRVLHRYRHYTLLEVRAETGRTHQIRIHLAAVGLPVAGDRVYGRHRDPLLPRQFLHAHQLGLALPSGRTLELESELPADLEAVLAELEAQDAPARGRAQGTHQERVQ